MRAGVEPYGPVQDTMFRALAVLRFVVLANAVAIYGVRVSAYDHPRVGAGVMALLALWTVFVVWAYAAPRRRTPVLLVADLLVAVVAIGLSPYVKGESMNATLPGFWVMGVVLAWAILWGWVGGLAAAVAVSVADLAVRGYFTQQVYGNIFLLVLGGAIVGFLSGLLQQTARERDLAERSAASAAERERLARVVHDGVLQALALVQRRAPELGAEGVELGQLAGEQEVRLRSLVQQVSLDRATPVGDQDLARRLSALQTQQRARRRPRHSCHPARRDGGGGHRCGGVVPEQRAPPRRAGRRGVGAARGARRPLGRACARRRAGHPGRPPGGLGRRGPPRCAAVHRRPDAGPGRHGHCPHGPRAGHRVGAGGAAEPRVAGRRMTIHPEHPFRDPEGDPVRTLRGRLGGAVTLWTSGDKDSVGSRAGLTVSSVMVAGGEPGRLLALIDPDSSLHDVLEETGRGVVHLLRWEHHDLAEAFAGQMPAPGGPFTTGEWEQTEHGPRLVTAVSWATVETESFSSVGWSDLVVVRMVDVVIGEDDSPLEHRRGRYLRPPGDA